VDKTIPFGEPAHRTRAILSGQHPTAERRPQRHSQPDGLRHGEVLAVSAAFDEAVLQLNPRNRDEPPQFGQGRRTCGHPRREVRQPGVENLSGARQIVEAAHDLVERGDQIREVHPQQVDVVGAEPAQTAFYGPHHGASAVAGLQHAIAFGTTDRELRCDGERVAPAVEKAIQILLGLTELIAGGRVDERAARVGEPPEDLRDVGLIRAVAPAGAKHACTKRQRRNAKTIVATKGEVFHETGQPIHGCVYSAILRSGVVRSNSARTSSSSTRFQHAFASSPARACPSTGAANARHLSSSC